MNFLRKLVRKGFERVHIPQSRRRASRRSRRSESEQTYDDEEDLDWRFVYNNQNNLKVTNSEPIQSYCQIQHLKYIAHITRFPNSAIKKQILFRTNKKRYARDPRLKYATITQMPKLQIQREIQDKQQFLNLMESLMGVQHTATAIRE